MNHKEEAIKRVDEIEHTTYSMVKDLQSKQCALLAINREIELIEKITNPFITDSYRLQLNSLIFDLKKVKKEIELL